MPTAEAPVKQKHETWRDWLPPNEPEPPLLTRAQVLARLESWRLDVTERDLRFWEAKGVLPRPVRRSHGGAVRAVYPDWYPPLVREVRRLQRFGFSLDRIRRKTRAFARYTMDINDDPGNPLDDEILEHRIGIVIEGPEDVRLPDAAVEGLRQLARWHERITGVPTDQVIAFVVDAEGNQTRYGLPIAETIRFVPVGPARLTPVEPVGVSDA